MTALTAEELMAWVDRTTRGWQELVTAHPEALRLPCDVRETQSVAELLQHIVAVELRFAERLHDLPETPYAQIGFDSAASIFRTHERAMSMLPELFGRGPEFWDEVVEIQTRSAGRMRTSRKTMLVHLLMHSVRHYAQLATLVRQHGIAPGWQMDYLMMGVVADA